MNIYVNEFHIATSRNKDEVIIHFSQRSPRFEEDGKISDTTAELAAALSMNFETAENLASILREMLDEEPAG